MGTLIGFGLFVCVSDIAKGSPSKDEVVFIFSESNVTTEKEVNDLIEALSIPWKDERCGKICKELFISGKIIQTRLFGLKPISSLGDHWHPAEPFQDAMLKLLETVENMKKGLEVYESLK